MPKLLKIGIVGCGAIGSSLAKTILSDFADQTVLIGLYDIDTQKAYALASKLNNPKLAVLNLDNLLNKAGLVIEATKPDAVWGIAKKALSCGADIMIMSVGGLLEKYAELELLAREKEKKVYIPSGAICGIDGLRAARNCKINKVTLITRKPARAFLGVPYVLKRKINLEKITEDTVVFEGSAAMAVRAFPQNINVAATLSLAGLGEDKTTVRLVASPHVSRNIHEVEIDSEAGKISCRSENVIHPDNPKTSYLAVLSAVATLRGILAPIKIGS
jgi:aspartate dehydrogenase